MPLRLRPFHATLADADRAPSNCSRGRALSTRRSSSSFIATSFACIALSLRAGPLPGGAPEGNGEVAPPTLRTPFGPPAAPRGATLADVCRTGLCGRAAGVGASVVAEALPPCGRAAGVGASVDAEALPPCIRRRGLCVRLGAATAVAAAPPELCRTGLWGLLRGDCCRSGLEGARGREGEASPGRGRAFGALRTFAPGDAAAGREGLDPAPALLAGTQEPALPASNCSRRTCSRSFARSRSASAARWLTSAAWRRSSRAFDFASQFWRWQPMPRPCARCMRCCSVIEVRSCSLDSALVSAFSSERRAAAMAHSIGTSSSSRERCTEVGRELLLGLGPKLLKLAFRIRCNVSAGAVWACVVSTCVVSAYAWPEKLKADFGLQSMEVDASSSSFVVVCEFCASLSGA